MTTAPRTVVDSLIRDYRNGELSRREFFQKVAFALGSIALAHELMLREGFASEWEAFNWPDPQDQAPPTPKESIAAGEKRLPPSVAAEWVEYPSGNVKVGAYLARPKTGAPFAAIVVIHETAASPSSCSTSPSVGLAKACWRLRRTASRASAARQSSIRWTPRGRELADLSALASWPTSTPRSAI